MLACRLTDSRLDRYFDRRGAKCEGDVTKRDGGSFGDDGITDECGSFSGMGNRSR